MVDWPAQKEDCSDVPELARNLARALYETFLAEGEKYRTAQNDALRLCFSVPDAILPAWSKASGAKSAKQSSQEHISKLERAFDIVDAEAEQLGKTFEKDFDFGGKNRPLLPHWWSLGAFFGTSRISEKAASDLYSRRLLAPLVTINGRILRPAEMKINVPQDIRAQELRLVDYFCYGFNLTEPSRLVLENTTLNHGAYFQPVYKGRPEDYRVPLEIETRIIPSRGQPAFRNPLRAQIKTKSKP